MNGGDAETEDDKDLDLAEDLQAIEPGKEDGSNDIFKHTFVDILDDEKPSKPSNEGSSNVITLPKEQKK